MISPPLFGGINLVVTAYNAFGMLPVSFCYIIANDVHLYLKWSYSAVFCSCDIMSGLVLDWGWFEGGISIRGTEILGI